jgi:hypothetical protein
MKAMDLHIKLFGTVVSALLPILEVAVSNGADTSYPE